MHTILGNIANLRNRIAYDFVKFTKSHTTLGNIVDLGNRIAHDFVKLDLQNLIRLREK